MGANDRWTKIQPGEVVFDAAVNPGATHLGAPVAVISDQVMGGISRGTLEATGVDGRAALRLSGDVRLENDGGFIQVAMDLGASDGRGGGEGVDAAAARGLVLAVHGNGAEYNVHLRTPAVVRPWQSYRATFTASPAWSEITLPFESFRPHRLAVPLDRTRLRRLGIVAIGRAFRADIAIARIAYV